MSSTASFSVNTSDVYNSKLVTRNNTTLVETESVLFFSLALIHETFSDIYTVINQAISLVLNFLFLLSSK